MIRYRPAKILAKMANPKNVEKLATPSLTVNRAALNAIATAGVLGKKQLEFVALGVLKDYRERATTLEDEGLTKADARGEILDDPSLLIQRVQNATVAAITEKVQEQYHGEFYIWTESSAAVPDEKHKKKYGKRFQLGKGEKPGDRYGCKCGMDILVKESRLVLE